MHGAKSEKSDTVQVQVRVGPSRIAGQGLFAAQNITKGTRVIQYIGEKITKRASEERLDDGNAYIMYLNNQDDIDGKTHKNLARYINHSCDPNCALDNTGRTIWIVATRDIPAGEELSYDYGFVPEECDEYLCTCGASNCRGFILAREYWGLLEGHGH